MSRSNRLSLSEERSRYDLHQNNVENSQYQTFVQPLVKAVQSIIPPPAKILDYGCGQGPVAAHLLRVQGYEVSLYDPYFFPKKEPLETTYDAVICSEVAEHFHFPHRELALLKNFLKSNGKLFFMTLLFANQIRFEDWHYQRDPTHVSFYSPTTFEWIRNHYGFSTLTIHGERLVILS